MYVDESGDYGVAGSPSPIVVLSGLIIHESHWRPCLQKIVEFRKQMKAQYGLPVRAEIHAAKLLSKPGDLASIPKHNRLAIIRAFADLLGSMTGLSVINVVINKAGKHDSQEVFEAAWETLIQRFENTLSRQNFPESQAAGPVGARGMIFPDHTDDKRLRQLLRRMRHFNPIPNQGVYGRGFRNLPLSMIVEDPNFRNSKDSYFVQSVDLVAFLLYQREHPSSYMKSKSGQNYFNRLEPILCKVASSSDKFGIVRR